ncbi:Mur ligase family protein [Tomitella biformata]|uniref:Mur ligase family protein n=1 Tax=Tomitella biformata TaxID=630403 RepID=UPI0004B54DB0|nr:MurT ligase domain-containing protein [Tomitella biformata]
MINERMVNAPSNRLTARGRLAMSLASSAAWASRKAGRGKGSMIGGLIALKVDKTIMGQLAADKRTVLVTGTNGKSTTNRMVAAALRTLGPVATNEDGSNMDAGLVAALGVGRDAQIAALEVDELHTPHVADATNPQVAILLNLSRDQLDRVGEINSIERRLREGLAKHPTTTMIANCDDVLITSIAFDAPSVVWVAAGAGWTNDAAGCPRCGEPIIREDIGWHCAGCDLARPTPDWSVDDTHISGPKGLREPLTLQLPGRANRGNAAQAIAATVFMGVRPADAIAAAGTVLEVAGRYRTVHRGPHQIRMLLAKNPAGWQEALSMVDRDADGLVIAVNGQVPDGEDLSWLWDVKFEHFGGLQVVASGERGADLAVRLTYADVDHKLEKSVLRAIEACPPGRVEVLANYTALLALDRALDREGHGETAATDTTGNGGL